MLVQAAGFFFPSHFETRYLPGVVERSIVVKSLTCPQCKTQVAWEGNQHRPFCSDRCRQIDLGQWADGSYRIAASPVLVDDDFVDVSTDENQ